MDLTDRGPVHRVRFPHPIEASAWSPDGGYLATYSSAGGLDVRRAGDLDRELVVATPTFIAGSPVVSWSPTSHELLVLGAHEGTVLEVHGDRVLRRRELDLPAKHPFSDAVWSPDGGDIAAASRDGEAILVLDPHSGRTRSLPTSVQARNVRLLWDRSTGLVLSHDHIARSGDPGSRIVFARWPRVDMTWVEDPHARSSVSALAGLPGGSVISVGEDRSAAVWDIGGQRLLRRLEGVTRDGPPLGISVCAERGLLVIREQWVEHVWSTRAWVELGTVEGTQWRSPGFRPGTGVYALVDGDELVVRDLSAVSAPPTTSSRGHYRNAKVVLVGDSGVGKSGLALRLTGQPYRPTSSTHGRHVWTLDRREAEMEDREILLWDLAGQPGYRLFHRLSLRDVAVGLVLFDAHSESDPFAGVAYWSAALDEAARGAPLVKLLVAARTDRGGPGVSERRVEEVLRQYGFARLLETSAELGRGVAELWEEIHRRIDWPALPAISAPALFADMHKFLTTEKERGRLLAADDTLLADFRRSGDRVEVDPMLFHGCLMRQEAAGLVSRIQFGDQWLLQPELLDSYAAWLAHAARDEPDGLGALSERRALRGDFDHERRLATADERVMLLAAVEEVVGRGLVLRVTTERGEMLVFPSEVREDRPDHSGRYVGAVRFRFTGPVSAIYATAVVKLANSVAFRRHRFYRRTALFRGPRGQLCGVEMSYTRPGDDSLGELLVFFESGTEKDVRLLLLRYVNEQLNQTVLTGSLVRERIYQCTTGHPPVPADWVRIRRAEGFGTVLCPGCGENIPLDDLAEETSEADAEVRALDRTAAAEQRRQQRLAVLAARTEDQRYQVFLCHNRADRTQVDQLNRHLADQGVLAWLDLDVIGAGDQFVPALEKVLDQVPAAAVLIGPSDLGRWQRQEYQVLLQRFVTAQTLTIIPVLLPGVPADAVLPAFLRTMDWVDLRAGLDDRKGIRKLVVAITSRS